MKPTPTQLAAMVADGRATEIQHIVRACRLEGGNLVLLTDDGEVLDSFVQVTDRNGVLVSERRKGPLEMIAAQARRGAAGILLLLDSPLAGILEAVTGKSLGRLRRVADALSHRSRLDQALALVDEIGSERARAVAEVIDQARADGKLSPEELAEIVAVSRGEA